MAESVLQVVVVQWVGKEGKKDGFVSTLTRAVSILPEGKPLCGGPCQKIEIEEVDVRPIGTKGSEKMTRRTPTHGRPKSAKQELAGHSCSPTAAC